MNDTGKIKQLLKKIDPNVEITSEAERMIILMVNDFISDVTDGSCRIANMREGRSVEMRDVALYLKKNWDIDVEGYGIGTTNSDRTVSL